MIDSPVMTSRPRRHAEADGLLPPWCLSPPTPVRLFSRDAVRAVDRAAIERYGLSGLVLMENAARGLLETALDMLPEAGCAAPVHIFCGSGNNGGDGYALARHLDIAGYAVRLIAPKAPGPSTDAGVNAAICARMEIPVTPLDELDRHPRPSLIVDAIFGTGLDRPVEGEPRRMIERINRSGIPVLAVDAPSGLDVETGEALGTAIRATRTVTFVGLKVGFLRASAEPYVGRVSVASIGVPGDLLEEYGELLGEDAS